MPKKVLTFGFPVIADGQDENGAAAHWSVVTM
jgi:hypothetical protein